MRFRQEPEGGNRLHGDVTLLWYIFVRRILSKNANVVTDFLAFLVIVVFTVKARSMGSRVPRILRAIIQDATVYFLFIFTSHLVFEMTLLFARVSTPPAGVRSVRLKISVAKSTTFAGQVSTRVPCLPRNTHSSCPLILR